MEPRTAPDDEQLNAELHTFLDGRTPAAGATLFDDADARDEAAADIDAQILAALVSP